MNLTTDILPPDLESQKGRYLQRVNQLYTNIQHWLQNQPLQIHVSDLEIEEVLGRYQVPQLAIATTQGDLLAEFQPAGAAVMLAEGAIEVKGWLDQEYLVYMKHSDPQTFYTGIERDGWYWIEQRLAATTHFISDKNSLLQLITWVSDYEF